MARQIIAVEIAQQDADARADYWRERNYNARVVRRIVRALGTWTQVYAVVIWRRDGGPVAE